MRISQGYFSISYEFHRTECNKKCYAERNDATEAADKHRREIVCYEGMGEYWCSYHESWHVGHAHKHQPHKLKFQEDIKFFQSYGRQN